MHRRYFCQRELLAELRKISENSILVQNLILALYVAIDLYIIRVHNIFVHVLAQIFRARSRNSTYRNRESSRSHRMSHLFLFDFGVRRKPREKTGIFLLENIFQTVKACVYWMATCIYVDFERMKNADRFLSDVFPSCLSVTCVFCYGPIFKFVDQSLLLKSL